MQIKQIMKGLGEKIWNRMDLKFVSLLIAYFFMFNELLILLMVLLSSTVDEEVVRMWYHNFPANLVVYVVTAYFIILIATMMMTCSFLLIVSLHTKNRQCFNAYLLCCTFTLVMSIVFNILYELTFVTDPTASHPREFGLSVLLNALYIFIIKSYCARLNSNNVTAQVETA